MTEPALPTAWDTWQFWQTTSDGSVTGIEGRVDLNVFNGDAETLQRVYGNGGEEPTMGDITIINRNGFPVEGMNWESVQQDYGLSLTRAQVPDGEKAFRLVQLIYDDSADTNWRVYVLGENGAPLAGVAAFLGIYPDSGTELPDDMAPLIAPDTYEQPEGRPNRALVLEPNEANFTTIEGYIQHSLGPGSNYVPPALGGDGTGTHWAWATGTYSDVPAGFGMWDNHKMFWPVLQLVQEGDEPVEPPEPGEDDVLAELQAIRTSLERIEDILETVYRVS